MRKWMLAILFTVGLLAGLLPGTALAAPQPDYLSFTAVDANMTLSLQGIGSSLTNPPLQYSFNQSDWFPLQYTGHDSDNLTVSEGSTVYFQTTTAAGGISDADNYWKFVISGSGTMQAGGSVMSLLDPACQATVVDDCGLRYLFYGCDKLTTAPALPATQVGAGAYSNMFNGCFNLAAAPALPATQLGDSCYSYMFSRCWCMEAGPAELPAKAMKEDCYWYMFDDCLTLESAPVIRAETLAEACFEGMFNNCDALEAAPALPAANTAESCYAYMFNECDGLKTPPPVLPAKTLEDSCYYKMFYGCDKLEAAPRIMAETMGSQSCQEMFYNCPALKTAPELQAAAVAPDCCRNMFSYCTAMETAPSVLPAKTLAEGCYNSMFSDCPALTAAPRIMAETMAAYCCGYMFDGDINLRTVPDLYAVTMAAYCCQYMFMDCEALETAPQIPAETMADHCCYNMFSDCTALKTAPALWAETLADHCYAYMFYGCPSLDWTAVRFTDWGTTETDNWVNGVQTVGGTFLCPAALDRTKTGSSGIPENWTASFPAFFVKTAPVSGGAVKASPMAGIEGDTVTLTVLPDAGYTAAGTPTVLDKDGQPVAVTPVAGASGQYTFTLPASDVTVSGRFSNGSGGHSTTYYTVPLSGPNGAEKGKATVSGSTATLRDLSASALQKLLGNEGKAGAVSADFTAMGKKLNGAVLPASLVTALADRGDRLEVLLPAAAVSLDGETVAQAGKNALRVNARTGLSCLSKTQQKALGETEPALALEISVTAGGKSPIQDGVTVRVPLAGQDGQAGTLRVQAVAENGALTDVACSADGDTVTFAPGPFTDFILFYDDASHGHGVKDCPRDATCPIEPFADTANDAWWHDGIHYCIEAGLMNGLRADRFGPDLTLSRGMLVTVLYRLAGQPEAQAEAGFADVPAGMYYADPVAWAAEQGIVKGYSADTFGPNAPVTREQLCVILARYAQAVQGESAGTETSSLPFTDSASVSPWAADGVLWCSENGVVNGLPDGRFAPQGTATRAEAAAMLQRFCER